MVHQEDIYTFFKIIFFIRVHLILNVYQFLPYSKVKQFYVYISPLFFSKGFLGGTVVKNLPANAGDAGGSGLIPGSGRSPGVGNGNPLWHSCLENAKDRGAWQATVYGVIKSQTQLSMHVIPISISRLFQFSFPLRSPQSIEQSSPCYTVGFHQLSVLYRVVYICQSQSPSSSHPPSLLGIHMFVLYICVCISTLKVSSSVLS